MSWENIPLFQYLQPQEALPLREYAKELTFRSGNIIFRQGDRSAELYIVIKGKVRFEYEVPEGGHNVLSQATDGMLFGEVAFLLSIPRMATAIAEENTEIVVFEHDHLQELMNAHPSLASIFYRAIAMELARRLQEATPRIL